MEQSRNFRERLDRALNLGFVGLQGYLEWVSTQMTDIPRKSDNNYYPDLVKVNPDHSQIRLVSPPASSDNCALYALLRVLGFEIELAYLEALVFEIRLLCDLPLEVPLDSESVFKIVKRLFPSVNLTIVTINLSGHSVEDSNCSAMVEFSNVYGHSDYSNFLVLINCMDSAHYHYVRKEESRRGTDDMVVNAILLNLGLQIA